LNRVKFSPAVVRAIRAEPLALECRITWRYRRDRPGSDLLIEKSGGIIRVQDVPEKRFVHSER
jgi:hypothetical protein